MGLETVTYISDLDPANPTSSDPKSQGDNHLRNIKTGILNTFPNITGEVSATQAELNRMAGVTSPVQTQIDALSTGKYDKAGGTVTGEVNVQPASGDALVSISRASGSNRRVRGRTGTVLRWTLDLGDNAAEAGSNAGSDFALSRYNDGGTLLAVALKIARNTGAVTIPGAVALGGAVTATGTVSVPTPSAPGHATTQQWVVDYVASQASSGNTILRESRTSNTAIAATDVGKWLDCSGTFTQTFNSCASLGNGFWCYLGNSGTGDVTIDPSGSETFDGITSFVMYPGEVRLVHCDGSVLRSIVLQAFYKTLTASGDIIDPPGYKRIEGRLWGGGGSGGKTGSANAAGAGGGGACAPIEYEPVPGTVRPAVIAAVAPGPSVAGNGTAGANSTFFGVTAYGGGAAGAPAANLGGTGGGLMGPGVTMATGTTVTQGGAPQNGAAAANTITNTGYGGGGRSTTTVAGSSVWGGAPSRGSNTADIFALYGGGGGGDGSSTLVNGVPSRFGGNGGNGGDTTSGGDGIAPGGGGGGTRTGTKAGDGARGELRLWGVI